MSSEGIEAAGRAERVTGTEGLAGVLPFLFAVRWGAWAIAIIAINFGNLRDENSSHEPVLLALSFAEILVMTLYVPLLRDRVRGRIGAGWGARDDLIVLGLADVAFVLSVIFFSGGWSSPYYQYSLTALIVPAFLVGWRRSALLLVAYLAAYFVILSTAGRGTDGTWVDEDIAAIIISPLLIVVVVQYLAQLTRRLEQQRAQAHRSYLETSALYRVAQMVAAADAVKPLIAHVVETLEGLARFRGLAVLSMREDGTLTVEAGFGDAAAREQPLSDDDKRALSQVDAVVALAEEGGETQDRLAVPVQVQDRLWGIVTFTSVAGQSQEADVRLARAVSGLLSLGMTKIALSNQKEELAAQEERSRIAREIHDGIAQSIYMLSLNLEKAAETARGDETLGPQLGRLVGLAKEALLEVRHYIFDLKPLLSGDAGLTSTIQSQVQEFTAVSGLPVALKVEGEERKVPLAVGSSLYRIAQEALANIYRHAEATQIDAILSFDADWVSLEIRDNGCGFAVDGSGTASVGRGLRNIHQRAAEMGGEARISSVPEEGTTVRVKLPAAG